MSFYIFKFLIFGEDFIINDNNKIGLVLSGGGAKGLAHIGPLKILDEEKIPVDYIVGTSIGSIIGALYSMGYSGEEIEKIILSRNWLNYFNDTIARENELVENKVDKDKYLATLSFEKGKLYIPKGAVKGQNIDKVLEELYIGAKDINDFSKLPIPFACVATDSETGNPVIFTKGYLPEAIRSSMSLPGLLDPVEIDGKLLLDGGLSNNFPVSVALDMGADFIIGSDVIKSLSNKYNLNNALLIMNQIVSYKKSKIVEEEKKKVTVLVTPNISKFNLLSFSNAEEIIDEGERASREKIDQLLKFKNEKKYAEIRKNKIEKPDKFQINDIVINNSKSMNSKNLKKIIGLNLPTELSTDDLNKLIDKLYNLNIFSKVNYKISGTTLKINVEDSLDKEIKFGFNYNNSTKGDLFFKFIKKDPYFYGDKITGELLLGKDEIAKIESTKYIGPLNKLGLSFGVNYSNIEDYSFVNENELISKFNLNLFNLDFMIGTFLSNSQMIGLGVKKEFLNTNFQNINDYDKSNYEFLYLKYIYDSLDNIYYPKKGMYIESLFNHCLNDKEDPIVYSYKFKINKPFQISEKLSLNIGAEKDFIGADNPSPLYMPSLGGIYSRQNSTPFWGLDSADYFSHSIFSSFAELHYEWKPYRYSILRINQGFLSPNSLYNDNSILGGGLGFGLKTPIGPIQFIISKSNKKDIVGYFNLGYFF